MSEWLPALDGIVAKLERGARIADVGCGHGISTMLMAKAFPKSRFVGVLIEIFRSNAVAADSGFPRESDVPLEYLMGTPADLGVGAVAVESLAPLWRSLLPLERPVAVVAAARTLI